MLNECVALADPTFRGAGGIAIPGEYQPDG
jgi:hypothetical protein